MTNKNTKSFAHRLSLRTVPVLVSIFVLISIERSAATTPPENPSSPKSVPNKLEPSSEERNYSNLNAVESSLNKTLGSIGSIHQRLTTAKLKGSHDLEPLQKISTLVDKFALHETPVFKLKSEFAAITELHQQNNTKAAKNRLIALGKKIHEIDDIFTLIEKTVEAELHAEQRQKDSKMYYMMRMKTKVPAKAQRAYGLMEIARQKREQGRFKEALLLWDQSERLVKESFEEHAESMANWREQNDKKVALRRIKIKALVEAYLKDHLVKIPGGTFKMGDGHGAPSEQPLHEVVIKPFYLGKTEVTFELYDLCREDKGCYNHPSDMDWGREDRPVINVSHTDIVNRFLPWLNKVTGKKYRLPSEAEWEFAARSGSEKNYSWGNNILCSQARFNGGPGSTCDTNNMKNQGTYRVKTFEPNNFGLYDMHGNVWEWVEDCWTINYNKAPSDGGPQKVGNCNARALRGGAWDSNKQLLRSASRYYFPKEARREKFGFRLAKDTE